MTTRLKEESAKGVFTSYEEKILDAARQFKENIVLELDLKADDENMIRTWCTANGLRVLAFSNTGFLSTVTLNIKYSTMNKTVLEEHGKLETFKPYEDALVNAAKNFSKIATVKLGDMKHEPMVRNWCAVRGIRCDKEGIDSVKLSWS